MRSFFCAVARTHSSQASQQAPKRPSSAGTSASAVALSPACRPPVPRPLLAGSSASPVESSSACRLPVPRPRVQPLQVDRPSSSLSHVSRPSSPSLQVSQPAPLVPGNLFRATSAPVVGHLPTSRGGYGAQSELAPRAPAPHLQFRPPRSHSMAPVNQQQLPGLELTSSSSRAQSSPVAQGTSLLSSSQPTLLANPSTSDSHQAPLASSAMSNLHSALPATSSPSSSHPVLPASSLAPGSSPSHLAQHVPPMPCTTTSASGVATAAASGVATAAASSVAPAGRRIGPFVEGSMQATDAGSVSLDAWLTANLGLSSGSPRVGAPVNGGIDVVCLSDDD